MKFTVNSFLGIAPRSNARYLPDGAAQEALNVEAFGQALRPLRDFSAPVMTLGSSPVAALYRFGQTATDEDEFWLEWDAAVDVVRSQIADDATEWTFYTDGEYPKATNANLIGATAPLPNDWVRLGIPAPAAAAEVETAENGPSLTFDRETWEKFSIADDLVFTFTPTISGSPFTVNLTDVSTAAAIVTAINSHFTGGQIVAYSDGDLIRVCADADYQANTVKTAWGANATRAVYGVKHLYSWFFRTYYYQVTLNQEAWSTFTIENGIRFNSTAITLTSLTQANIRTAIDNALSASYTVTSSGTDIIITGPISTNPSSFAIYWEYGQDKFIISSWTEGVPESRTYTWTWVSTIDGLTMESGAAPPSRVVSLDPLSGLVMLSGLPADVASDQNVRVTGKRIYRASAGVFLFVAEIPAQQTSFTDVRLAENLGEVLPEAASAEMPPDGLVGLVNLPNGFMAGFVDSDLYVSLAYRPYAFPVNYRRTLDYPIVGLGVIDTTLVVLTQGNPYFLQGASPEVMVQVKSDKEQACVSKRSIVSMGGMVVYASPDGLIMLSPGGSQILTEGRFERSDWQALNPETIHAYKHDERYIAFHDVAADGSTGFVVDFKTGEFIKHTLVATAGHADLRNDTLFLATTDGALVKWGQGDYLVGKWRSKVVSLPQISGFSCAQVEAEAYAGCVIDDHIDPDYTTAAACTAAGYCTIGGEVDPTKTTAAACTGASGTWTSYNGTWTYPTCRVYLDGTEIHEQTVTGRDFFRLPLVQGRDLEVELDVVSETFRVSVAQSPTELASD